MKRKTIVIAEPHGFCSGVRRAIETAEAALKAFSPPVYCLHEIVHNAQIVRDLSNRGVRFVDSLEEVPEGAVLLFSAHGVAPELKKRAKRKCLKVIDATCPFVAKVHAEARLFAADGCSVLIIGHRNHDEVIGVAGEARGKALVVENEEEARSVQVPNPELVGVVCQTTLSASHADGIINILRERFPALRAATQSDICFATQNRQNAVIALAKVADLVLVLGSPNSANTRRLVEVSEEAGCPAVRAGSLNELNAISFVNVETVGITSGASTPESFLIDATNYLLSNGFEKTERLIIVEESAERFPLPAELREART